jgi:hypothetical protein
LDVFAHSPEADQEVLTNLKQGKINNAYLSKVAVQHRLYPYLRAVELSIGLEKVLLTPPGCLPPSPALSASPLPFGTKAFDGSNIYTADDMPDIDFLFISHDHWDHLDYETIIKIKPKVNSL